MIEADLIIIGGGPAGLMTAGIAAEKNPKAKIIIVEKNKELGKKLSITGGGRCNILNANFNKEELLSKYGDSKDFLYSTFSQFNVKETVDFFKKLNLEIIVQENNRAFPKTENAKDVVKTMEKHVNKSNIQILKNTEIKKINFNKNNILNLETTKGEVLKAKQFVFATGGLSHSETGSTGDGFMWLRQLGHTVKNPTPTLVPWKVSDAWIKTNSGTSIEHIKISVFTDDKKSFDCKGRVLLTHKGFSGPIILNHSNKLRDALYNGQIKAFLDFYPELNHAEIDKIILDLFDKNKNKKVKNILNKIFKINSIEEILNSNLQIDSEKQINLISKEERKRIVQTLTKLEINITGLEGYKKSIVADGGVELKEIDTKTMKSKIIDNLFIVGDLLNIRRPSGGYSLQLCWTTGYVAGIHALE
jgi:predicted Rossmann fold flavoprotein